MGEASPIEEDSVLPIELVGHSGARVMCYQQKGLPAFVRKMSLSFKGNVRLKDQKEKQERFARQGVRTAQVYGEGSFDQLYYFDMQCIPATSIAEQLCSGVIYARREFLETIDGWLRRMKQQAHGEITKEMITGKLKSVIEGSSRSIYLSNLQPRFQSTAERLLSLKWSTIPRSDCHGDFTTENMLCNREGKLFLIDFDCSELSSYYMDAAKLYQDLLGLWCLRKIALGNSRSVSMRNAEIAIRSIRQEVDSIIRDVDVSMVATIPMLVCLNLMRVLPYCTDSSTCEYVLDRIDQVLTFHCE
jgi:hypothetical protein